MASEASARRSRGASRARPRLKVILALVVATAAVADQPAATLAQTTQPVGPVAGPIPIRSGLAWASGNSGKARPVRDVAPPAAGLAHDLLWQADLGRRRQLDGRVGGALRWIVESRGYAAALAPVTSAQVAKAWARAARYSVAVT
jgi:hypothetical protein